jgi:hypothetical protein
MDGNDSVGDCTCADVDHEVKAAQVAAGNPQVQSTAAEVLAAYSAITGYNPDDPSTDQGAEMQAVRDYWRTTGFTLGGTVHKVVLFAELPCQDTTTVRWALDQFGTVGVGVNLPAAAQQQFADGQPWDVVADDGGIDGGHAVALVGYDTDYAYVLTWGQVQRATWAWWARYVEECWTTLDEDFVNTASGKDELGGTLYDLGAQFERVTGQPNPFPAPQPSPAPVPVPSPTPEPVPQPVPPSPTPGPAPDTDPVDLALVAVAGPWANEEHLTHTARAVARAIRTWRQSKGL